MRGDLAKRSCEEVGAFLRRLRTALGLRLEDVVERVTESGLELTTSTLSRAERGIAALPPHALLAVCDALGAGLDEIEDVIRAAQARQEVVLESVSFDDLVARGKKAARAGDIAKARIWFVAAEDWVSLHPDQRPPREAIVDLWLWLGTACVKMDLTRLARRYAALVLNDPESVADEELQALLLMIQIAIHERDLYACRSLARQVERSLGGASRDVRGRAEYEVGRVHVVSRRYQRAVEILEAARKTLAAAGNTIDSLRASVLLGFALTKCGQISRGRRLIRTALRFSPRRRNPELFIWCHQHLGQIAYDLGEPTEGLSHLSEAALAARAAGVPRLEFVLWSIAWTAERAAGRIDRARAIERTLRRLLRRVGGRLPEAREFIAESDRSALADGRSS